MKMGSRYTMGYSSAVKKNEVCSSEDAPRNDYIERGNPGRKTDTACSSSSLTPSSKSSDVSMKYNME